MTKPPARPALKLKLSTSHIPKNNSVESTPSSATPKIKFKLGGDASKPSTPPAAEGTAAPKEKKPRKIFKTPKGPQNGASPSSSSKKRSKAPDDDGDGVEEPKPQIKRLKLTNKGPVTPIIRAKLKGKPPARPLGVGYDSEASDRETDPAIEEEFVLRMVPGEDCEYLQKAIEEKKLGVSKREGGADVTMKFFNREGRRAVITIRQRHYAAVMVDLPCVIEGLKSWDRRGWWKTADICQMLQVVGQVPTEEAALAVPLPPLVDPKTYQYPHGLTAPMRFARKRRFRKRISNKTIEAVEDEVERLLAEDQTCEPGSSKYEVVDLDRMTRDNSVVQDNEVGFNMLGNAGMQDADYEEDAEGEVDDTAYFDNVDAEDGEGLEADLEMAMMADDDDIVDVPSATTAPAVETPVAETPVNGVPTPSAAEESGDESSDADADDEDAPQDIDEDALERQRELQQQKEEIADLESAIASETAKLEGLSNPHLRDKLVMKIRSLKSDLDLKRGMSGLEEE